MAEAFKISDVYRRLRYKQYIRISRHPREHSRDSGSRLYESSSKIEIEREKIEYILRQ